MHRLSQPAEPFETELVQPDRPTPAVVRTDIRVKGEAISAASVEIKGRTVCTQGGWLLTAGVRDEELVEGDTVADPESFILELKESGLRADLFTFAQRLPSTMPKHSYHIEWENAAAVPITSFSDWWKERAEYSIRKGVNRAKKLGVTVELAEFNDQFVGAICDIYNETPVRQGKAFWHYQKDFPSVKNALATYLDRSLFIGAYYGNDLIGFIKMTYVDSTATITQILSAKKHFDKRPNNALIAKAIEVCASQGRSHFIYGSFVYFDPDSTLTEFKRRNGFDAVSLPRYYIPLTLKGKVALRMGFHREIARQLPRPIFKQFLKLRSQWYAHTAKLT